MADFSEQSQQPQAMSPVTPCNTPHANKRPLPLDPMLYKLDDGQLKFLKVTTGITNDEDLRRHIMKVQAKAYAVGKVSE